MEETGVKHINKGGCMKVVAEKGEIWKRAIRKGVEIDRYVSSLGVVIDLKGNVMKLCDNGAGYISVARGEGRREYVHRLVAETFIPNPNNLPQVNHIDCDKSNNCVENLEWISGRDNIKDAHAKGRMKKRSERGTISILSKDQVVTLYRSVLNGRGISEMARELGIPRTTASSIINKRSRSDITDLLDLEHARTRLA